MLSGTVSPSLEPVVELALLDSEGAGDQVPCIVDTGFNRFLTLPQRLIRQLRLAWRKSVPATLADDSVVWLDTYVGRVVWEGQEKEIEIQCSESDPLIGMRLLKGCSFNMIVEEGGPVTISSIVNRNGDHP